MDDRPAFVNVSRRRPMPVTLSEEPFRQLGAEQLNCGMASRAKRTPRLPAGYGRSSPLLGDDSRTRPPDQRIGSPRRCGLTLEPVAEQWWANSFRATERRTHDHPVRRPFPVIGAHRGARISRAAMDGQTPPIAEPAAHGVALRECAARPAANESRRAAVDTESGRG